MTEGLRAILELSLGTVRTPLNFDDTQSATSELRSTTAPSGHEHIRAPGIFTSPVSSPLYLVSPTSCWGLSSGLSVNQHVCINYRLVHISSLVCYYTLSPTLERQPGCGIS